MSYTLDAKVEELEFSARTANALKDYGCVTLRDAAQKLDYLKQHARGFGHKSYREVKEAVQYASQTQGDMLQQAEYRDYVLEDRLTSISAILADVNARLIRAALTRRISFKSRRDIALKLRDAANLAEQLPTVRGN